MMAFACKSRLRRQCDSIRLPLLHSELFLPEPGVVTLEELIIGAVVFGKINEISDGLTDFHIAQGLLVIEVLLANVETVLFRVLNDLLNGKYPEHIPGSLFIQIEIIV